jgi:hypothetical protein
MLKQKTLPDRIREIQIEAESQHPNPMSTASK